MGCRQLVQRLRIREQDFSITDDGEPLLITFVTVPFPRVVRRDILLYHVSGGSIVQTLVDGCIFVGIPVQAILYRLVPYIVLCRRQSRPKASAEPHASVKTHFTVGIHLPDATIEMITREIFRSSVKSLGPSL